MNCTLIFALFQNLQVFIFDILNDKLIILVKSLRFLLFWNIAIMIEKKTSTDVAHAVRRALCVQNVKHTIL